MSFKKFALAMIVVAASAQAQASMVTWGVNVDLGNGNVATGTAYFDDATIQALFDGANDPNDTHIFGATFTMTSAALGWANQVFSNMTFQPYYYISYNDGPHVDSTFSANDFFMFLGDEGFASSSIGDGTWAFDRNVTPVPATLPLMGLGLAALAFSRKQKAAK